MHASTSPIASGKEKYVTAVFAFAVLTYVCSSVKSPSVDTPTSAKKRRRSKRHSINPSALPADLGITPSVQEEVAPVPTPVNVPEQSVSTNTPSRPKPEESDIPPVVPSAPAGTVPSSVPMSAASTPSACKAASRAAVRSAPKVPAKGMNFVIEIPVSTKNSRILFLYFFFFFSLFASLIFIGKGRERVLYLPHTA